MFIFLSETTLLSTCGEAYLSLQFRAISLLHVVYFAPCFFYRGYTQATTNAWQANPMGGASLGTSFGTPKAIALLVLTFVSVTAPSLLARIPFFRTQEPALVSILLGGVVGVVMYFVLNAVFAKDLTPKSIRSTAAIMGLITAHVGVYEIADKIPTIPVYALFVFLFYFHFDEGVELQDPLVKND
mmetsp:Transcript_19308/g.34366  ORF Transcript_19308/g.34366 Transcript_19308/m.34366 type:complete len:185 (-) Transcript_19308:240-794(-)